MYQADRALQPSNLSYFNVAVAAYAAGLAMCFTANEIFHNGQPALLYLDPSLVGSTLGKPYYFSVLCIVICFKYYW